MRASRTWARALASLTVAASLSGCGGSATTPQFATAAPQVNAFANLDPSAGTLQALPIPCDMLLRNPGTGNNNLPGTSGPVQAFNALQGFSTSAPIYIPFVATLDPASVTSSTVRVIDTTTQAAVNVTLSVKSGTSGDTIVATPVRPLVAGHTHLVIVTNAVTSSSGVPVQSAFIPGLLKQATSLTDAGGHSLVTGVLDAQAQQLEQLRQAWQSIWAAAESATGKTRADIPMAFTFTTQQLYSTLQSLNTAVGNATAATPTVAGLNGAPTGSYYGSAFVNGFFTALGQAAIPHANIGAVYTGTFTSPNYISYTDPNNPAGAPWQLSGLVPTKQSDRTQQFVALLPDKVAHPLPPGGYPTVIFVHGITRNMFDVLPLANTLTNQGIAVIAINQPLHGSNTLIPANAYQNSATGDGYGYLNLTNPATGRDNVRQAVADLFELTHAITAGNTHFDNTNYANQNLLAMTPPALVGHSLGSIVGSVYLATEQSAQTAVLNVAGGRLGSLLQNSTFTPQVNAGLAQAGIVPGTGAYQDFFWVTQAVLDNADGFNYAQFIGGDTVRGGNTAPGLTHYTLVQEMVDDPTVPNSATADLAHSMALPQAYAKVVVPGLNQVSGPSVQGSMLYQFNGNKDHGFLLDGTAATVAGQTQVVSYLGSYFLSAPGGPSISNVQPLAGPRPTAPWSFDFTVRTSGVLVMPDRF